MLKGQTGEEVTAFSSVRACTIGDVSEGVCSLPSAGSEAWSTVDFHLTTLSLHVSSHTKNRDGASKQATYLVAMNHWPRTRKYIQCIKV